MVLHPDGQLERLAGIEGIDIGECGLQPRIGEGSLHLDRLALHSGLGRGAPSRTLA
jgi:hypothetical protein